MVENINGFFPGVLEPDHVIANCVNIYENVWENPDQTIIDIEKEVDDKNSGLFWPKAHTIGGGPYQNIRTNSNMPITDLAMQTGNPIAQQIHNQFYALLLASVLPYNKQYNISEGVFFEHYNFLKYSEGTEYKAHYDSGGTATIHRYLSAILYLNDDYEGGELEFVNFNVKIKPAKGTLILFPSNYAYAHVAHPVKSGTKYALVTWVRTTL